MTYTSSSLVSLIGPDEAYQKNRLVLNSGEEPVAPGLQLGDVHLDLVHGPVQVSDRSVGEPVQDTLSVLLLTNRCLNSFI